MDLKARIRRRISEKDYY